MATASAPQESPHPSGRPGTGTAAARTEQLFAEYSRTVIGLCRALLRDRAEAEDAAQQTFLSAHRALLGGTDPREPAAWLATIARNECWARIRTRMREPLPTEELETVSTANDPLAEAIRRADLAALWRAIEALPRQQRDALLLREFGGLSYGELAAALAVSGSAVESLLFRARNRLRGQLRTAYAAISGASWIEGLLRLFAGGGAPVAAKVAVLGVGAAALGSTAVVVPHVLDNYHPSKGPARTPAALVHRHKAAATPAPAVVVDVALPKAPAAHDAGRGKHEGGTANEGHGSQQGRQEPAQGGDTGGHDGQGPSGSDGSGRAGSGGDGGQGGDHGSASDGSQVTVRTEDGSSGRGGPGSSDGQSDSTAVDSSGGPDTSGGPSSSGDSGSSGGSPGGPTDTSGGGSGGPDGSGGDGGGSSSDSGK